MSQKYSYTVALSGTPGSLRFTADDDAFGQALRGYLRGQAGAPTFWEGLANGATTIIAFAHVVRVDVELVPEQPALSFAATPYPAVER